jgi:hypothetical protein
MQIVNLTPHPVTIIRSIPDPTGAPADRIESSTTYPACAPADLPRAIETPRPDNGCMELSVSGDTQDAYANAVSMSASGVVDSVGYSGVESLPDLTPNERAFGVDTFRIVSIVTAIGALAAGRPIVDLLVPMGQIRDATGRIIGASALAPASALLSPMAERLIEIGHVQARGPRHRASYVGGDGQSVALGARSYEAAVADAVNRAGSDVPVRVERQRFDGTWESVARPSAS